MIQKVNRKFPGLNFLNPSIRTKNKINLLAGRVYKCQFCSKKYKLQKHLIAHWSYKHKIKKPLENYKKGSSPDAPDSPTTSNGDSSSEPHYQEHEPGKEDDEESISPDPVILKPPEIEKSKPEVPLDVLPDLPPKVLRKKQQLPKKIRLKKKTLRYRKIHSMHRKKILDCNCTLSQASKQEIRTCYTNYNKMRARGMRFGQFYFFKDFKRNLFALKIFSRINCVVLRYNDKNTRQFKRLVKRRLLKRRQIKYLMLYSGYFD